MVMDLARYEAMDAQRFDPMRRTNIHSSPLVLPSKKVMGQILRRLSQPEVPPNRAVGGIWSDHELVLVPIEVSSHRESIVSTLTPSVSSSSSQSSDASVSTASSSQSQSSSSTYFTTPSPTAENGLPVDAVPSQSSVGSRQVETFDRDDLIITRTIIRPATQPSIRGIFSRPNSPAPPPSRPCSPLFRPTTPVFQALNCFRPSAFERDLDDIQAERSKQGTGTSQPVLQVIVTQTREQYEQDLAFKEVVQQVYPEASRPRRTMTH